jgi:hypothetical protein
VRAGGRSGADSDPRHSTAVFSIGQLFVLAYVMRGRREQTAGSKTTRAAASA